MSLNVIENKLDGSKIMVEMTNRNLYELQIEMNKILQALNPSDSLVEMENYTRETLEDVHKIDDKQGILVKLENQALNVGHKANISIQRTKTLGHTLARINKVLFAKIPAKSIEVKEYINEDQ